MKMQIFGVVLLILLVLTASLHADSPAVNNVEKAGKGAISIPCTVKCANWWKCRILGLFFRKCTKPAGCNCSQFAWEGWIFSRTEMIFSIVLFPLNKYLIFYLLRLSYEIDRTCSILSSGNSYFRMNRNWSKKSDENNRFAILDILITE